MKTKSELKAEILANKRIYDTPELEDFEINNFEIFGDNPDYLQYLLITFLDDSCYITFNKYNFQFEVVICNDYKEFNNFNDAFDYLFENWIMFEYYEEKVIVCKK